MGMSSGVVFCGGAGGGGAVHRGGSGGWVAGAPGVRAPGWLPSPALPAQRRAPPSGGMAPRPPTAPPARGGSRTLCSFWCHSSIQVPLSSLILLRCMMFRISSRTACVRCGVVDGGRQGCAGAELRPSDCPGLHRTKAGALQAAASQAVHPPAPPAPPSAAGARLRVAAAAHGGQHEAGPLLGPAAGARVGVGDGVRQALRRRAQDARLRVVVVGVQSGAGGVVGGGTVNGRARRRRGAPGGQLQPSSSPTSPTPPAIPAASPPHLRVVVALPGQLADRGVAQPDVDAHQAALHILEAALLGGDGWVEKDHAL